MITNSSVLSSFEKCPLKFSLHVVVMDDLIRTRLDQFLGGITYVRVYACVFCEWDI